MCACTYNLSREQRHSNNFYRLDSTLSVLRECVVSVADKVKDLGELKEAVTVNMKHTVNSLFPTSLAKLTCDKICRH